jgi:hypothetical protein
MLLVPELRFFEELLELLCLLDIIYNINIYIIMPPVIKPPVIKPIIPIFVCKAECPTCLHKKCYDI